LSAWQTRLSDLLAEVSDDAGADSEVAGELRDLTTTVLAQLPTSQQTWVMNVVAREGGRAFGVQGGDVHYHDYQGGAAPQPSRRDGITDASYSG
jgi:hypothetical protein